MGDFRLGGRKTENELHPVAIGNQTVMPPSRRQVTAQLAILTFAPAIFSGCKSSGDEVAKPMPPPKVDEYGNLSFGHYETYRVRSGDQLEMLFQLRIAKNMSAYRISGSDTLSVKFPNATQLNETQPVRPDGLITMPYVGEVRAAGKTVAELTGDLRRRYAKILRSPDLYITTPQFLQQLREFKEDLKTTVRGLSRLINVRPDGVATFPMIGHIKVAGRTIEAINSDINNNYQSINPNLRVDLFLERHADSIVYVFGHVNQAGGFVIRRPITVLEAIALAGGFDALANKNSVSIVRRQGNKMVASIVDVTAMFDGKNKIDNFLIYPEDIVYVSKDLISSLAQLMQDLSNIVLYRGWNLGFSWELKDRQAVSQ
jgi:polysaccharide biosynthesis/export protein